MIVTDKTVKNKKKERAKPSPRKLLAWYDQKRRAMPWRAPAGHPANPYYVWLSEIMLQQTTVAAVIPYFIRFVGRWPTLRDLSAASLEDVFQMWAGLGYYRRARGLYECATVLTRDYGGDFPQDEATLQSLPGVGPYTSAAIAAIAFDQRANVVDGNVERVMARIFAVEEPMPKAKKRLKELAAQNLPASRFGDYAQALMDLGATVCTPRSPKCSDCPWRGACLARERDSAESLPRRAAPAVKPVRRAYAFVLQDKQGRVLLRRRPPTGLLASMMEVPSSPWQEGKELAWAQAERYAPVKAGWELLSGGVRHSFTHFDLEVRVAVAVTDAKKSEGKWVSLSGQAGEALPSIMRKILSFAYQKR